MIPSLEQQIQSIVARARSDGVAASADAVRDHLERAGRVAGAEPADVGAAVLSGGAECWAELLRWLKLEGEEVRRAVA